MEEEKMINQTEEEVLTQPNVDGEETIGTSETTTEEPTEQPKRSKFQERIMGRYPELNPQSDDEWNEAYEAYATERDSQIEENNTLIQAVEDVITADDDARSVLEEMIKNKTPFRVAIAKFLDKEDLIPQEGEADYEQMLGAYNERLEKGKKRVADAEQITKNEQESEATFISFCEEKGMDEEQMKKFDNQIQDIFSNLLWKKLDKKTLETMFKGLNYEKAVEKAKQEGEIKGRNANIEAKRVRSDKNKSGDGLPNPTGGVSQVAEGEEDGNVFGVKQRKNI